MHSPLISGTRRLGVLLLAMLWLPLRAQTVWNYQIADAGGGNSLVTWSVTGPLTTSGVTRTGGPLQAIPITAPGLYADTYTADGTSQSIPAPDGSFFLDMIGGLQGPITGYYTLNVSGSNDDGFGLLLSIFPSRNGDLLTYHAGTESVLIPVAFSDFNPGTYESQMTGLAVTVNLTVEPAPEPDTLALAGAGGVSLLLLRGTKGRRAATDALQASATPS